MRIRYQTIEFGSFDIHVCTLRNVQQFEQSEADAAEAVGVGPPQWSLFGVLWDASRVLAQRMSTHDIVGLRIIEVGCGIALPSLVLNERGADVTSMDKNPSADAFLARNVRLNDGREIPFVRHPWNEPHETLGQFDLITGSDLLYEQGQVETLCGFVQRHAEPAATVIHVGPGRSYLGQFTAKMQQMGFRTEREYVPTAASKRDVRVITCIRDG
jgi:predicted nicotinamide N-methyase